MTYLRKNKSRNEGTLGVLYCDATRRDCFRLSYRVLRQDPRQNTRAHDIASNKGQTDHAQIRRRPQEGNVTKLKVTWSFLSLLLLLRSCCPHRQHRLPRQPFKRSRTIYTSSHHSTGRCAATYYLHPKEVDLSALSHHLSINTGKDSRMLNCHFRQLPCNSHPSRHPRRRYLPRRLHRRRRLAATGGTQPAHAQRIRAPARPVDISPVCSTLRGLAARDPSK